MKSCVERNIPTISELAERPRRRLSWGSWKFAPSTLVLRHRRGYGIDLGTCTTSAETLDWIFQVSKKTWMRPKDRSDLLEAFEYLLNPQGTLCSCGRNLTCDRKEHFRKLWRSGR
jgi:hypothetical protein